MGVKSKLLDIGSIKEAEKTEITTVLSMEAKEKHERRLQDIQLEPLEVGSFWCQ